MKILKLGLCLGISLLFFSKASFSQASELKLKAELPYEATDGQIQLEWGGGEPPFMLLAQYKESSDYVEIYSGNSRAYFMSGIPEGAHRFRLLSGEQTVDFEIISNFPPTFQVKVFLILGGLLFATLVFIVTKGYLTNERKIA